MEKAKKSAAKRNSHSGRFVMTRSAFAKLNAVEGLSQSASSRDLFHALEREGASPEERRRAVAAKYAPQKR